MGDHAARLREENIEVIRRADSLQVLLEASHIDVQEHRPEELPIHDDRIGQRRCHIVLAISRPEFIRVGQHRLVRLLRFRIPIRRLIADQRFHAVRPHEGNEATRRIRIGRIRHFCVFAVESIRCETHPCPQDSRRRLHRIAQHLHDRLPASRFRLRLQDIPNAHLGKRGGLICPFIAHLNSRGEHAKLIELFRFRPLLQRFISHITDNS